MTELHVVYFVLAALVVEGGWLVLSGTGLLNRLRFRRRARQPKTSQAEERERTTRQLRPALIQQFKLLPAVEPAVESEVEPPRPDAPSNADRRALAGFLASVQRAERERRTRQLSPAEELALLQAEEEAGLLRLEASLATACQPPATQEGDTACEEREGGERLADPAAATTLSALLTQAIDLWDSLLPGEPVTEAQVQSAHALVTALASASAGSRDASATRKKAS